jgi:hypothetical protein
MDRVCTQTGGVEMRIEGAVGAGNARRTGCEMAKSQRAKGPNEGGVERFGGADAARCAAHESSGSGPLRSPAHGPSALAVQNWTAAVCGDVAAVLRGCSDRGRTQALIAARLGVSARTVGGWVHRHGLGRERISAGRLVQLLGPGVLDEPGREDLAGRLGRRVGLRLVSAGACARAEADPARGVLEATAAVGDLAGAVARARRACGPGGADVTGAERAGLLRAARAAQRELDEVVAGLEGG